MPHTDTHAPRYLNQIALAPAETPPRIAAVQIARWSHGRRLAWQTLDPASPVYQWALDGLHDATTTRSAKP